MLQPPFYLSLKVRMFWVIRFHPSHRLFSHLRNHSTVSLTILIRVFLVLISSNLVNHVSRCKKRQESGWDGPFDVGLITGFCRPCDRIFRPRWYVGNLDKKPMILCAHTTSRSRETHITSFVHFNYCQNNNIVFLVKFSRCAKVCD